MESQSMVILGANGQLGKALCSKYPDATALDSKGLDISNAEQVNNYDWSGIKTIVNAAAYTNVDGAETPEGRLRAWGVNAQGVANLAAIALKNDVVLVHVSTDYVFDGSVDSHKETEPLSPLGVYGKTKAAGDFAASLAPKHYTLRTSWVVGDGKNFVKTMLWVGENKDSATVVADQIGRLTFTSELVNAVDHLLTQAPEYGTYNVSNTGDPVSWSEITREIFSIAGYNIPIIDSTTEEYFAGKSGIAPRPLLSTLDLKKIQSTGFVGTDWKEDLRNYISAVQGGNL